MKKNNEFNETLFFPVVSTFKSYSSLYVSHDTFSPNEKKNSQLIVDRSFLIAEFGISQSCLCFHFFTVYKYDNYLHDRLMGGSNNLENIKVRVAFTTRKTPSPNI